MSETDTEKIMAVGAHPDDIEFGCGAILLQEANRGAGIELVVCSRGESGTNGTAEIRTKEAEDAAEFMDARLHFREMEGDGLIRPSKENALTLARMIRELQPRLVLAPTCVENQHPDHAVAGRLVREAARLARYGGLATLDTTPAWRIDAVLYYALSPSAEPCRTPTFVIDVSQQRERWETLMRCHASQMKTRNYLDMQIARARVWGLQSGSEYAQALWSEDPVQASGLGTIAGTAYRM